jgi:CRISPR-associated protein Csd1
MILSALAGYYDRRQRDPDPARRLPPYGFEDKSIPFILEIDPNGRLTQIRDTRQPARKGLRGQEFLVPRAVKKSSGIAANLLWDTAEYVLGVPARAELERVAQQHAAFRARVDGLVSGEVEDEGLRAVAAFLSAIDRSTLEAQLLWPEILADNALLTFQLAGDPDLVCQRPRVVAAIGRAAEVEQEPVIRCLVDGEDAPLERLHGAIKGVWGAQSSGANIVSFNLAAFQSYGKLQGANAPVGKRAAFAYTTALNHLLSDSSRQRVQVGDAATVFWADRPSELESALAQAFGEPPKDNPHRGREAVRAILEAVSSGRLAAAEGDTLFFVLSLAPNAARIAVRVWHCAPLRDIAGRVWQHFDDLRLVRRSDMDPEFPSLFRLLAACAVQGKAENIPPRLGGEVLRAVIEGLPYPAVWLDLAVQRCRAEREVNYLRASAIKAWLNRDLRRRGALVSTCEKEFGPMLDPENPDAAYRLGRLFATLEKIQEEASPGLNATIRDRYYGGASSSPVMVFTTLLRLKNHHVAKLHQGRRVQMERLIGEIMSTLTGFPTHMPVRQQGSFALGYYHQRQAFFTKIERDQPNAPPHEEP